MHRTTSEQNVYYNKAKKNKTVFIQLRAFAKIVVIPTMLQWELNSQLQFMSLDSYGVGFHYVVAKITNLGD